MKIYLTPPQPSRGLQRIADALTWCKPADAEIVTETDYADFVIIYAIGRRNGLERQIANIKEQGQRYAIVQCCLRSTMQPHTKAWRDIWHDAEVVWSYYDLNAAIDDDGGACGLDNFYHAPLGADASVFTSVYSEAREFIITTSGESRLSESVRECWLAAEAISAKAIHLGPLKPPKHVTPITNISDDEVAKCYSRCQFVSALRRTEGFELPGIEGLLCGARPICFDTPDYRRWYEPFAEFIEEGTRQQVVDQLVALFRKGARPITAEERAVAVERFNWETIIGGFYERIK
jgi:hypothetical protein